MEFSEARQLFAALIVCAILLFAVESFIPGGILGAFGIIALIAATIIGYQAFEPYGTVVAIAIAVTAIVMFILWLRILPRTWIAKKLTINKDLSDSHATDDRLNNLIGLTGPALCKLHPGGFAKIDGRKIDVITQGEMVEQGTTVKVIEIEGNRVVVTELQD